MVLHRGLKVVAMSNSVSVALRLDSDDQPLPERFSAADGG